MTYFQSETQLFYPLADTYSTISFSLVATYIQLFYPLTYVYSD